MLIVGQMRTYITIEPTGRVNLFGIRFRPGGACAFFAPPLSELAERILPLSDLWPLQARALAERIQAASSLAERGRISEAFLLRHLLRPYNTDALVEAGVQRILCNDGRLSSGALLEGMNISERQLERRFQAKVGLSPKQLARIIRFQKIFAAYERNPLGSWISLAYECGYYDQAHLIRDFKEFSGQNPSSYFQQASDFSHYFTGRHRMSEFSKTDD
jgi:AraC-like DNA-binding protein